ncbi:MAG: fluoride efflux transporter CrcB [Bacteroidetes bacterium]|nr:fluoride efflux transporter CrcB [Bacteroidota bacterium]
MNNLLAVFVGGGIGSFLRFLISNIFKSNLNTIPFATLGINIIGCFLIGIISTLINDENSILKFLLVVGFCGGFTTFSAYGIETIQLLNTGKYFTAIFYVILSNITCIISVYAGIKVTLLF